jgi:type 2A phosphatase activator TIP41
MPHSFFILSRLFVRVDNVLFRIYDVRIYHAFGSEELVREVSGLEAGYEDVKRVRPNKPYAVQLMDLGEQRLAKQSDLSPLTSSNFVHGVMTSMTGEDGRPKLPHRTTGKAWPGLEKRVDVLRIPVGPGDADGAADGLEKLLI